MKQRRPNESIVVALFLTPQPTRISSRIANQQRQARSEILTPLEELAIEALMDLSRS